MPGLQSESAAQQFALWFQIQIQPAVTLLLSGLTGNERQLLPLPRATDTKILWFRFPHSDGIQLLNPPTAYLIGSRSQRTLAY